MKETFTIIEGTHFTPVGLVNHLNRDHMDKVTAAQKRKKTVNINDIHQYILKGALPSHYGKTSLKEIYIPYCDLKLIELTWN